VPYLGIDTATSRGSIALAGPDRLLAEAPLLERSAHARDLLGRIDAILRQVGVTTRDLLGIGVAVGPGSFTGVRVGMATAKGLAYALNVGLGGLSTLEAIAQAAHGVAAGSGAPVCAAIEAGRGEIYAALFRLEGDAFARAWADRSLLPARLLAELPPGALLAGDGAGTILREAGRAGRKDLEAVEVACLAGPIASWASRSIEREAGYRPGTATPNYVRPADVEASRRPL